MFPLLGALIGAGTSLIGGAMNNAATAEANASNRAMQEKANADNLAAQKDFAQNGIRWRVEDAQRSGVHPLYALGAQTTPFQASFGASVDQPATGMASGLAAAGQDIGRAVGATLTTEERAYNATLQTLALDRAALENDLLRSQIRRTLVETGPSFPSAGGIVPPGPDLMLGGDRFRTDKGTSPAEAYQTQYGDVVENLVGVPMAIGDLWRHMTSGILPWIEATPGRSRVVRETQERTRNMSPFPYDVYHNSPSAR